MTKFLVVHPGADYSTADVYQGLVDGLEALGHDVVTYELGSRLGISARALTEAWTQAGRKDKPDHRVVTYNAGHGVYATIVREGVEAVLIVTAQFWNPDHTIIIRRLGLPVGVILTECPYLDEQTAASTPVADVVWVNERTSVDVIRRGAAALAAGGFWATDPTMVRYLAAGWNPKRHDGATRAADDPEVPSHDVVFVGSGYQERIEFLEAAAAAGAFRGLDFGLWGDWPYLWPSWSPAAFWRLAAPAAIRLGKALAALGLASPLFRFLRGGVIKNQITTALYRQATVGLNLFRTSGVYSRDPGREQVGGAESLGPRVFELAATGTFFLSEHRAELLDVFGASVPSFRTPGELASLVREWTDPTRADERKARAEAARLAVQAHTWRHRAEQVVADLNEAIALRKAKADPVFLPPPVKDD